MSIVRNGVAKTGRTDEDLLPRLQHAQRERRLEPQPPLPAVGTKSVCRCAVGEIEAEHDVYCRRLAFPLGHVSWRFGVFGDRHDRSGRRVGYRWVIVSSRTLRIRSRVKREIPGVKFYSM